MLHLINKQKHCRKPEYILEKSQIKNDQLFYFFNSPDYQIFFHIQTGAKK